MKIIVVVYEEEDGALWAAYKMNSDQWREFCREKLPTANITELMALGRLEIAAE